MNVRPKKKLGQHFLNDENIARNIANAILQEPIKHLIEIGPGTGVLTKHIVDKHSDFKAIELDKESVSYLSEHYPDLELISGDFLKLKADDIFTDHTSIVGNFPYNISSQIFFKVIENRDKIPFVVGMIQKEVAERIQEKEGSKVYGILSVLLQTFYDVEYLFTVNENVFTPPPKVKSAVIKLKRNNRASLPCDEKLYFRLIKESFNQRRKMIRSSLRQHLLGIDDCKYATWRPEQMSIDDFIALTQMVEHRARQER